MIHLRAWKTSEDDVLVGHAGADDTLEHWEPKD